MTRVLVTGAAGFIGGHLCRYLKGLGYWVRGVDYTPPRYGEVVCDEADWRCDLRDASNAHRAVVGCEWVFALAATMGGAGFIFTGDNDLEIMSDNLRINLNTLTAAVYGGVVRYLFSSSACVYPQHLQEVPDAPPLRESDAYPAYPDSAYGWEKIMTERMCLAAGRLTGLETRIVRFHNVYGPRGSWNDGREKAPAALCRKVAAAKREGRRLIDVWGDGEQTRSFMFIDDCLEGLRRLMASDWRKPLNLGRDRMVSINELVDLIAGVAGWPVEKAHDLSKPQGVRGRNSDNTLCRQVLGWAPPTALEEGLVETYDWIEEQVKKA
jgi:GDP-D-mannose 3',5'-epimerase